MATKDDVTVSDMFRSAPVRSAMVSVLPLLLVLGQFANSYFNGLSIFASTAFALTVTLFAVLLTQHQLAEFRLRHVEREL